MHFFAEAEFWVAVAFVIFVGVLVYVGVPKMLLNALDERGKRVQAELDEARRLKEEAQKLLAEYKASSARPTKRPPRSSRAPRPRPSGSPPNRKPRWKSSSRAAPSWPRPRSRRPRRRRSPMCAPQRPKPPSAAAEKILTESVKGKVADDLHRPRHRRREDEAELASAAGRSNFTPISRSAVQTT